MSHKFFTKENKLDKSIFVKPEDADKYVSEADLSTKGKHTTYKGVPRYQFRRINLFPFKAHVDLSMNEKYTEEEKNRMSIPKWCKGKTVSLIGIYTEVTGKIKGHDYKSGCTGSALTAKKIIAKQKGIAGDVGHFYYEVSDKDVISFFKLRGYEVITNSYGQKDRISFAKIIYSEEEGNQLYEDVYDFDQKFKK